MNILEDTAIFAVIVQQGGFSRAAKKLGLSNGLISRRMTQLETELGVTLLNRTTRQFHLTPEGEMLFQHAVRIQQEMDAARCLIQSLSEKPKGHIRVSAPPYFGRYCLMPILIKFMQTFEDIQIDFVMTEQYLDPLKEKIDLLIRGVGYFDKTFKNSSLTTKFLIKQKIVLYASGDYLLKHSEPKVPEDLLTHDIIGFNSDIHHAPHEVWNYDYAGKSSHIMLQPKFNCNDGDSRVQACRFGQGIAKFTELFIQETDAAKQLKPILPQYSWGEFNIYAVYAKQQSLPKRTRLLLEFIVAHTKNLMDIPITTL